jgi:DDE family transposase
MSRRLRTPGFKQFMKALSARMAGKASSSLIRRVDGKALSVAAHSTDRHASWGRGAGGKAKGYKLHAIWSDGPMPEQWIVAPLNVSEKPMAQRMIKRMGQSGHGGGYLLGDGYYDSSELYDDCADIQYQLLAPRQHPGSGLGHRYVSDYRIRGIELLEPPAGINPFGPELHRQRLQVERDQGNLTSFGGGLMNLPAWVRTMPRVQRWVWAKLLINAARIRYRRALGA